MIKFGIRNAEFGIIFAPDLGHETPEFLRGGFYTKNQAKLTYMGFAPIFCL